MIKRSIAAIAILGALVLASGCFGDSSLTVRNESSYALTDIYLAPVGGAWGGNLLGGLLPPGGEVTIDFITCDSYDVRIIDETNAEACSYNRDLCWVNDVWVVDDAYFGGVCN